MQRKKTKEEVKKLEYVKMSELADYNGVRYSTILYYAGLGLLPFIQKGEKLARYYPLKEASQRLKEILKMREKGKSIPDVLKHYKK